MKIPGYFEFKHAGQSYFGVQSLDRGRRRACIIIEDTPRPYLNWVLGIADRFDLQLVTILPFSNDSIGLLKGESVQFGTSKPSPKLTILDPSQCVVILDMHNDPERGQVFDGYDPSNPDLAGLAFWQRVPDSQGIHFLIASRFPEETFADVGLTLNFTEIDKSRLMVNPNLPQHTVDQLNRKLTTVYGKAAAHAQCDFRHLAPTEFAMRYFGETVPSIHGKPVARLYHLLRHQKLSNNELCKLSGSPYRTDDTIVGKGLTKASGRFYEDEDDGPPAWPIGAEPSAKLTSLFEMYKRAQAEHKKCSAEYKAAKKAASVSSAATRQRIAAIQQELTKIRIEAEEHFQERYGCGFRYGGQVHGDHYDELFLGEEERGQLEKDFDSFHGRMEPLVREAQALEDSLGANAPNLKELAARLRAIGQQRDDLWRDMNRLGFRSPDGGAKPDETIRKDFVDPKSRDARGIYHCLRKAGASDALIQHFKDNIVSYGAGLQYIGALEWNIL